MRTINAGTIRTIRRPLLSTDTVNSSSGTRARHITSEDNMGSRVRTEDVLEVRLEAGVVSGVIVKGDIHGIGGVRVVDRQCGINTDRCAEAVGWREERLKGKVTADMMRDGVGDRNVLETASRDLVVIVCVTPRAETVSSGIVKDRGVFRIRGIYFWVRTSVQRITALRHYLRSSPNRGEHRCSRICLPFCPAWSGHRACARGRRNPFDEPVTS